MQYFMNYARFKTKVPLVSVFEVAHKIIQTLCPPGYVCIFPPIRTNNFFYSVRIKSN